MTGQENSLGFSALFHTFSTGVLLEGPHGKTHWRLEWQYVQWLKFS